MNTRAHFAKVRCQAKQIRVALDRYEQLIDDTESLLRTLPTSVHIRCNTSETACLCISLQVNSRQVYFTIRIDGLGDTLARTPHMKATLYRVKRNGDLDDGQNITARNLLRAFRWVCKELQP